MRLFLVLLRPARACPAAALAAGPPAATTGAALGRHAHDGDAERHRGPERLGHELPLRVRHDDGVRAHLRRRRRRRRGRRRRRSAIGLEGLSAGHDLPLPARGHQRRRRRARAPTARSARPPARALPGVSSTAAREVGPTGATLRSRIDPNRGATSYHFEYGLSQSYGSRTPERGAGAGDAARARRRGDRRPAAVPPLPLPRRGDQRGRPARQRQPHLHHAAACRPPSRSRSPRRARRGARGSRSRPRLRHAASTGSRSALERQDFPFAGPFSSIGAPAPMPRGPHGQLPLLRARRCSRPRACARSRARPCWPSARP